MPGLLLAAAPQDAVILLLHGIMGMLLPLFFLVGLVVVVASVFRIVFLPGLKARLGENAVNRRIHADLDPNVYRLITNVMLPTPTGTTQIDHVIVSRYGIFVVETKTYKGWIFGGEQDAEWTQVVFKFKHRFQNPVRQNFRHVKTMADLMGIPLDYFKPVVVFAGDATFKTETQKNVLRPDGLSEYVQSFTRALIRDEQVPEIVRVLEEWASTVADQTNAAHVRRLRKDHAPVPTDDDPPACPFCGARMVLRTRRRDNATFWGCSTYPKCRGTRKTE